MITFLFSLAFESFVNSERCKTRLWLWLVHEQFESFVNSERCKTLSSNHYGEFLFESFVNSERCKTVDKKYPLPYCLRALLIQKDVKLV